MILRLSYYVQFKEDAWWYRECTSNHAPLFETQTHHASQIFLYSNLQDTTWNYLLGPFNLCSPLFVCVEPSSQLQANGGLYVQMWPDLQVQTPVCILQSRFSLGFSKAMNVGLTLLPRTSISQWKHADQFWKSNPTVQNTSGQKCKGQVETASNMWPILSQVKSRYFS